MNANSDDLVMLHRRYRLSTSLKRCMWDMSKRKADTHRNNTRTRNISPQSSEPDRSLYIQAHEADIIRGPRGHAAALALQVRIVDGQEVTGESLVRWGARADSTRHRHEEEEEEDSISRAAANEEDKDAAVWVDRYAEFLHICNMASCVHERNEQHLTTIYCLTTE